MAEGLDTRDRRGGGRVGRDDEELPAGGDLVEAGLDGAWGGWIAITSSWLPVAGQIDGVYYSIACNGPGLVQAPYVGTLIADAIVDEELHEDLQTLWQDRPKFPRPLMTGRAGLRTIWAIDRFNDLINGSRRNARRGATVAAEPR